MSDATVFLIVGVVDAFLGIGIGLGGWPHWQLAGRFLYCMVFPFHTFCAGWWADDIRTRVPHGLSILATTFVVFVLMMRGMDEFDRDLWLAGLVLLCGGIMGITRMCEEGSGRGPLG